MGQGAKPTTDVDLKVLSLEAVSWQDWARSAGLL